MIKLRAHHLLCLPRCYSGGYNKIFAIRQKQICASLRKNPNQKIKVVRKVDDLCAKCLYRKGNVCVKTPIENKEVLLLDGKVLKRLKIKENSVRTAKDVFNLSMDKIPSVRILCKTCDMVESCCISGINNTGINSSFRTDLNK